MNKKTLGYLGLIAAAVLSYLAYRGYISQDQVKQIDAGVRQAPATTPIN